MNLKIKFYKILNFIFEVTKTIVEVTKITPLGRYSGKRGTFSRKKSTNRPSFSGDAHFSRGDLRWKNHNFMFHSHEKIHFVKSF